MSRNGPYGWLYFNRIALILLIFCIYIGIGVLYVSLTTDPHNKAFDDPHIQYLYKKAVEDALRNVK